MLTDEQRKKLLDMLFDAGVVGAPRRNPIAFYVESLLAQARAEAFEEAAKVCAEPERREDYVGGKTWVEYAATIRARKDAP